MIKFNRIAKRISNNKIYTKNLSRKAQSNYKYLFEIDVDCYMGNMIGEFIEDADIYDFLNEARDVVNKQIGKNDFAKDFATYVWSGIIESITIEFDINKACVIVNVCSNKKLDNIDLGDVREYIQDIIDDEWNGKINSRPIKKINDGNDNFEYIFIKLNNSPITYSEA